MKNLNIIFYVLLIMVTSSLVNAQSWTVYQADVEPTAFDPAFSESNGAGTFTYGTLVDPNDASNNLLSVKTDPTADKDNIQLRQYTDEDAVTVVLKARTIDIANKGLLFDIDFRSLLSARFAIKVLNDGTYDIDKGGDGVVEDKGDWGFDATSWNIFRITKAGDVVNIYLNEDPTPIFTLTAPAAVDGNGYWRFGDGWGDHNVDTQYDWVTWDYSGAYAPTESILPPELGGEIPVGDWTVYNADMDPTGFDPAFSESNGAGTFTYGTLVDPNDASNNLLSVKTDPTADKDNIQLRQYTDEDAVTVVLKARTIDIANKGLLFDIDFRSLLSARFAIKVLNDGTYDIDKGGDGVVEDKGDWGFDATAWNIFRITKAGDVVNIYLNEDPTPIFTLTAPAAVDGNGYWRFGDGWGDHNVDTQYDWVTWDYSGAYSPEQARLPDELVDKETPLGDWTIYNADVEPGAFDPVFSESNGAGTFTYGTIPDNYIPGNNLLGIRTDPTADKDNIQLRQYTDEDAVTVVLKARTIDIANKGLLFDIDFRSLLSARFAIKVLNDGTYDIDKGGDGVVEDKGDWGFDATSWNIFRITKAGDVVNIYLNEDPTPIFTLTAPAAVDGNGYWRFGDGWGDHNVDTQFDWVSWDYSGAYTPSQTRLPDDLVKPPVGDWTIYQADVEPEAFDPVFSESNGAGTFTYGTLADPDDASNNLLGIRTDPTADKDNIQLRQYTDEEAVTVVLKARTIDIANKGLLFDIDFRSLLSARFAIKVLNDGTYDIDKGGDGVVEDKGDWGFDATSWNIFRITKAGDVVNIYLNEDPTPIFTLTAPAAVDGNGYWRFGDGWGDQNVDTQYDWVTWDYSGAYAPDQARLPDELLGVEPEVPEPTLKILGSIDPLAQDLGYAPDFTIDTYRLSGSDLTDNITITPPENFEVSVDTVNWFTNANPLVIEQSGGIVDDTVIIVRLNASAIGDYSGDISNATPGAEEELVSASGTTIELIPEITITGTLEAFVQNISTPSASQNYRVSGVNLKDSITVTAPAGYEVSPDDSEWSTSFRIGATDRVISNAFVYVRQFASELGAISDSLAHASPDASEVKLAVSGEVITDPGITIAGEFTEFIQSLGTPSTSQFYTLTGSSLTSNIEISLPDGFEVSIDDDIWLNSLTLVPLEGTVETMTLFVRLNAAASGTFSGNIIHSSVGVDDVIKTVTGTADDIVLATLEPDQISFSVYPNPSIDKISFQRVIGLAEGRVSLYSLQGTLLSNYVIESGSRSLELDIRHLESGVYIVGYQGEGRVFTQRLIKK